MIQTLRSLHLWPRLDVKKGEVEILQQELGVEAALDAVADISNGSDVTPTAAEYAAAYVAADPHSSMRMPNFKREHKWALTYRSNDADVIGRPTPAERFPGMNATLDDSVVVGLRFELDYGWTR
ncbi:MAG: hypothetical protein ABW171_02765 [Steroidobacter sp.]